MPQPLHKPQFGPPMTIRVVPCSSGKDVELLDHNNTRVHRAVSSTEAFALRTLAGLVVMASVHDQDQPTPDVVLERLSERDRRRLAPHLRMILQDLTERLTGYASRVEALVPPDTGE